MADLVKQGRTKVPKFVLVYFFSDRTTAIVDKWKCTSTDPIVDFTKKFQETPADISTSEIVKVRYPTGKSDFGTYDGYIVAVSDDKSELMKLETSWVNANRLLFFDFSLEEQPTPSTTPSVASKTEAGAATTKKKTFTTTKKKIKKSGLSTAAKAKQVIANTKLTVLKEQAQSETVGAGLDVADKLREEFMSDIMPLNPPTDDHYKEMLKHVKVVMEQNNELVGMNRHLRRKQDDLRKNMETMMKSLDNINNLLQTLTQPNSNQFITTNPSQPTNVLTRNPPQPNQEIQEITEPLDQPGPSSLINQPGPSSFHNQPGPSSLIDQPGPSSFINQPGPSSFHDQPGPSSHTPLPATSSTSQLSLPTPQLINLPSNDHFTNQLTRQHSNTFTPIHQPVYPIISPPHITSTPGKSRHHQRRHLTQTIPHPFIQHPTIPRFQRITPNEPIHIYHRSSSLTEFATRLMRDIFKRDERRDKSVNGTRTGGITKDALDPIRVQYIRQQLFRFYSVPDSEKDKAWKKATNAMNEYLRRKTLNKSDIDLDVDT